jgi:isopentenyl diphosphate isomerase/L-lactate dehydrogenase-like FMN-dependent dehydrogenase
MSIEIKIDEATSQKLKAAAARKKLSQQDYVLQLLKKSLAIEDLNRLRKKFKGVAKKAGYKTEEDIFRDNS